MPIRTGVIVLWKARPGLGKHMKTYYKIQYWHTEQEAWRDTHNIYDLRQEAETACEYLESQCPVPLTFFRVIKIQETLLAELRQQEFSL